MSTKKKMLHQRKPVDDEKMLFDFQIYHTKSIFLQSYLWQHCKKSIETNHITKDICKANPLKNCK